MKKSILLRAACLALLIASIGLLLGCGKKTAVDACQEFLGLINAKDYESAYGMLCAGVRYDEERKAADEAAGNTQSAKRISQEQFISRYIAIFEELDIEGLTFSITSQVEGEIICVYDYTLTYKSEKIGDQSWDFRMTVLREDGKWKVDWSPSLLFPEMDWGDTIRVGTTNASRGEILADGQVYAETVKAISVVFIPSKIEDEPQFVRQLSVLLDMTSDAIYKELTRSYVVENDFGVLKQFRPGVLSDAQKEELLLIPGVGIDTGNYGTLRNYPQQGSLAHIIGYVRQADEDDLLRLIGGVIDEEGKLVDATTGAPIKNSLYNSDSVVGKLGLERQYETELRGEDGSYVYICASDGTNKDTLYREPAKNGLDIQLTVDAGLQERVETLLKYSLFGDNTAGAVIVMDPNTGAVDAMASYPSYDLNLFTGRLSDEDYKVLSEANNKPLYNRLTQGTYPPGSTIKPFTAAAALETGAMTKSTVFPDGKGETIEPIEGGGSDTRTWRPSNSGEFGPWGGGVFTRVKLNNRHSPLNMHAGIVDSDNIYFAYTALKTGFEPFMSFMENLGLTEAIPFDLSVSSARLINESTRLMLQENTLDATHTRLQLLGESAFGQGEMMVTPLQAASMFCALANGGDIMEPHIIKGLYRTEGTEYTAVSVREPKVWKPQVISASSISIIEPMMIDVVLEGTGKALNYSEDKEGKRSVPRSPKLTNVAAKTGTAQVGGDKSREISWFVGYRADADPEDARLVLVMLEIPASNSLYSNLKYDIAYDLLKP